MWVKHKKRVLFFTSSLLGFRGFVFFNFTVFPSIGIAVCFSYFYDLISTSLKRHKMRSSKQHFVIFCAVILFFSLSNLFGQVNLKNGLLYFYSFTNSLKDAAGKNDGTMSNPSYSDDRYGIKNSSIILPGNNYITFNKLILNPNPYNYLTIAVWVKLNSDNKEMSIICTDTLNSSRAISVVKKGEKYYYAVTIGKNEVLTGSPVIKNLWTLLVVVYSNPEKTIEFFNMSASGRANFSTKGNILNGMNNTYIGGNPSKKEAGLNGLIDDIYIYNRRLNTSEIYCLFKGCPMQEQIKKEDGKTKCDDDPLIIPKINSNNFYSTCADGNKRVTFFVDKLECADSYEWITPLGAVGTSTSEKIELTFPQAIQDGELKVRVIHKSRAGQYCVFPITINEKPTSKSISIAGPKSICLVDEPYKYNLSKQIAGAKVEWILPLNCSMNEEKSDFVKLVFNKKFQSGELKAVGKNDCGITDTVKLKITFIGPRLISAKYDGADKGKPNQKVKFSVKGCFENSTSYRIKTTSGIGITSRPISNNLRENYFEDFEVMFNNKLKKDTIFITGFNSDCGYGSDILSIAITLDSSNKGDKDIKTTEEEGTTPAIVNGSSFLKPLNKKIAGFSLAFVAFGQIEIMGQPFATAKVGNSTNEGNVFNGGESGNFTVGLHKDVKINCKNNSFEFSYVAGKDGNGNSGLLSVSGTLSADGKMLEAGKVTFTGYPGPGVFRLSEYKYSFEVRKVPAEETSPSGTKVFSISNFPKSSSFFSNFSYYKKEITSEDGGWGTTNMVSFDPGNQGNSFKLIMYYDKK